MKVVYLAELDEDIDDYIACLYLYNQNVLDYIVLDPIPKTEIGKQREQYLKNLNIIIKSNIEKDAKNIFVGGPLTNVAKFVEDNKIINLIMNGGFVGENIMKNPLPKFKGKREIRTFNFNSDVASAEKVLSSKNIDNIYLIGKNVCHSNKNTILDIWKDLAILKEHNIYVKEYKKLHDVLMCYEGINIIKKDINFQKLNYIEAYPYNLGNNKSFTLWGTEKEKNHDNNFNKVTVAVDWKK